MIPLSEPSLSGNESRYLTECIAKGWVSTAGEFVTAFENQLAEISGVRFAIATTCGTAALHTSLMIAGLEPGFEVLVPTLTFIAPINAVHYCNAVPVFIDCDDFYNIDLAKVEAFLTSQCRVEKGVLVNRTSGRRVWGVLPVHVFGNPVDCNRLLELCERFGLVMIEDASESLGSSFRGKQTGSFGLAGCFSFNGNKLVTTGGGGMIVTDSEKFAKKARYLTTQAKDDGLNYIHHEVGYNYRLTNLQAAVGVAQLEKLNDFIAKKRENYAIYKDALRDIPGLTLSDVPPETDCNHWFYPVRVDAADYGRTARELIAYLREADIESRPVWHLNHLQRPYAKCEAFEITRAPLLVESTICIPCSTGLTAQQRDTVIGALRKGRR